MTPKRTEYALWAILVVALALALIWTGKAKAEAVCNPDAKKIATYLKEKWKEEPRAQGLSGRGHVVTLYLSKDGKTWSLVLTLPNGPGCLVDNGTDWERDLTPVVPGEKS